MRQLKDTKKLSLGGKKHPLMIELKVALVIRTFGSLGVNIMLTVEGCSFTENSTEGSCH